jgi:hypothetical protein
MVVIVVGVVGFSIESCRSGRIGACSETLTAFVVLMSVTALAKSLGLEACRTGMLGGFPARNAALAFEKSLSAAVILFLDACRTGMVGGSSDTLATVDTPLIFIVL